jgi:hypothetical protein
MQLQFMQSGIKTKVIQLCIRSSNKFRIFNEKSLKSLHTCLHTHHVFFCLIYNQDIGFHIKNCSIDVDIGVPVVFFYFVFYN